MIQHTVDRLKDLVSIENTYIVTNEMYKDLILEHIPNLPIENMEVFHDFKKESHKRKKMTLAHMKSAVQYFNKWGWIFDKERKKINKEMVQKYGGGEIV